MTAFAFLAAGYLLGATSAYLALWCVGAALRKQVPPPRIVRLTDDGAQFVAYLGRN